MAEERHDRETDGAREGLVAFLADHAGKELRGVIRYDHQDYSFLYLREDVDDKYEDEETLTRIVQAHREAEPIEAERASDLRMGTHHVTLRLYEEAVLMHFPQGEYHGTLVALDVDAARDFAEFADACLHYLHHDSPQRIETLPDW